MALFKSFVLGEVRKSVANITMYSGANGYSIARGKRSTMRNPKTPGQLAQRAKMKALQKVSLYLLRRQNSVSREERREVRFITPS